LITRLDAALAAGGAVAALVWLVAGFAGHAQGARNGAAVAAGVCGALLAMRVGVTGRDPRDPRLLAAATFLFCAAVGFAEQLGSDLARGVIVVAALAGIVTVALRSLRHS